MDETVSQPQLGADFDAVLAPSYERVRDVVKGLKFKIAALLPRFRSLSAVVLYTVCAVAIAGATVVSNLNYVDITEGSVTKKVVTFSGTAAGILKGAGISTTADDKIIYSGINRNHGTVTVIPAVKVGITVDGGIKTVMIADGTAVQALQKAGVTLGSDDLVSIPLDTKLSSGTSIVVNRVTYADTVVKKAIPYGTVTKKTSLLRRGVTKVAFAGSNGQQSVTTRVKYIDGKADGSTVVSTKVDFKPVDCQLLVGTALATPVSQMSGSGVVLTAGGVPLNYSRCITGLATAYTARRGALTASGRRAGVGYVAVDPRVIPYGTRLYIQTANGSFVYGEAVAADTGTFVYDGSGVTVDLYFATMSECCRFGERTVKIYVLS